MPKTFRLTVEHGVLHFPNGGADFDVSFDAVENLPSMLLLQYPAGDCDTIPWPMPECNLPALRLRLARALFDERETNDFFPTDAVIELPDGTVFDFDSFLAGA